MRYLAVGDIHGNYKALVQVLERSGYDKNKDVLIGIGDYVDGHPESYEVVNLLMNLPKFIGIRGNHDLWFEKYLATSVAEDLWVRQGGEATLKSYKHAFGS